MAITEEEIRAIGEDLKAMDVRVKSLLRLRRDGIIAVPTIGLAILIALGVAWWDVPRRALLAITDARVLEGVKAAESRATLAAVSAESKQTEAESAAKAATSAKQRAEDAAEVLARLARVRPYVRTSQTYVESGDIGEHKACFLVDTGDANRTDQSVRCKVSYNQGNGKWTLERSGPVTCAAQCID